MIFLFLLMLSSGWLVSYVGQSGGDCINYSFFFFFKYLSRLSARISDFENVLLMVHVGGVHACAAGARYATFFFFNARF